MISPQVIRELLTVRQVLHYLPASPKTEKGWTPEEQQLFWDALAKFPQGPWTTIAEFIGTKSTRQAMTHGQKLRQKLNRWRKRLRRTPAAALALAEDPESLDDDVKASIALNTVMMTSAAMTSAAVTVARGSSPTAASTATATSTTATTSLAQVASATSAPLPTPAPVGSKRALYVDDLAPPAPRRSSVRPRSKLSASDAAFSPSATPTASSELSTADINYTALLMASLPIASAGAPSLASLPSSMVGASMVGDAMSTSFISTAPSIVPSLPYSFASSERHSINQQPHHRHSQPLYSLQDPDYSALYGGSIEHLQQQYREFAGVPHLVYSAPGYSDNAAPGVEHAVSSSAATTASAIAMPLFYADDEHYVLPQSMVDELADVLWDA